MWYILIGGRPYQQHNGTCVVAAVSILSIHDSLSEAQNASDKAADDGYDLLTIERVELSSQCRLILSRES